MLARCAFRPGYSASCAVNPPSTFSIARDARCLVAEEEHDRVTDLLGSQHAAERVPAAPLVDRRLGIVGRAPSRRAPQQVRVDRAGQHAVHPDALRGMVERERARHRGDPALGRRVGRDHAGAVRRVDRGERHHRATAAGGERRDRVLRGEEEALQVRIHDEVPVGLGEIRCRPVPGDAGARGDDVEPPPGGHRPRDGPLDGGARGDVARVPRRTSARRGDLLRHARRTLAVDVADRNGSTGGGEQPGRRRPDPARRTGDEADLARKVGHQAIR